MANKWKEISKAKRYFTVLAIILAIVIAYNGIQKWRKDKLLERVNASFGEVKASQDSKGVMVKIGVRNKSFYYMGKKPILYVDNEPILTFDIIDEKLVLSTIIRNKKGEPIAVIDKNEWTMYDYSYEYNNDDTSFEIVSKGDRRVYFQFEMQGEGVAISGFLINKFGEGTFFFSEPDGHGVLKRVEKDIDFEYPSINIDKPIFKYPREKYLGIRERE